MIDLGNTLVRVLMAAAMVLLYFAWLAYTVYKTPRLENHPSKRLPQPMHPDHERIIRDYTRGRSWS